MIDSKTKEDALANMKGPELLLEVLSREELECCRLTFLLNILQKGLASKSMCVHEKGLTHKKSIVAKQKLGTRKKVRFTH